jgi:predicted aspartyl protease
VKVYNAHVGHFQVRARLTGPTGRSEETELFVDSGATLVVLPRSLADRLGLVVNRRQRVSLAAGAEAEWPVAEVRVAIGDQEVPTLCFIAPDGPPLLGALALESLFVSVDPVNKRLVPTTGFA